MEFNMSSETSTTSNTTSSSAFTQEQLMEASGVYRGAAFAFYEGYTDAYNAAVQAL
jgi:hypothetical protein